MITVDEATQSYILKECHSHLLLDPESHSNSSSSCSTPSIPYSKRTVLIHATNFTASIIDCHDSESNTYTCLPMMHNVSSQCTAFQLSLPHSEYHILGHACRRGIMPNLSLNPTTQQYVFRDNLRDSITYYAHNPARPLYQQQIPFNTILIDTNTFQALIVTECDVIEEGLYGFIPLLLPTLPTAQDYLWGCLPQSLDYHILGLDSPQVRSMLRIDQSSVTYV